MCLVRAYTRRGVLRGLAVTAAGLVPVFATRNVAADGVPLAIKGYDPVAYFTVGKPTRGSAEFEYEWDERRYRFSRAEHRQLFEAQPARYLPQFADFCAMALSLGEVVEADPENWLITDGKLYLFGKPTGPALFRKNLAGNAAKANQNRTLLPKP
jgi:hypothetical protein